MVFCAYCGLNYSGSVILFLARQKTGIEVFTMRLTHSVNEFAVMGISFLGALF
jgi:hypothetical protein